MQQYVHQLGWGQTATPCTNIIDASHANRACANPEITVKKK